MFIQRCERYFLLNRLYALQSTWALALVDSMRISLWLFTMYAKVHFRTSAENALFVFLYNNYRMQFQSIEVVKFTASYSYQILLGIIRRCQPTQAIYFLAQTFRIPGAILQHLPLSISLDDQFQFFNILPCSVDIFILVAYRSQSF